MKILLVLVFALAVSSPTLLAQTTLSADNYSTLYPTEMLSWRYVNSSQLLQPEKGANRIWDFSSAVVTGYSIQTAATPTNPTFPSATISLPAEFTVSIYNIDVQQYYEFNAQGYYSLGDHYAAATLPGSSAGDTLFLPAQTVPLYRTELSFPATYGSTWSNAAARYVINADIKVGILPRTAAQLVQNYAASVDSIIGWGQLRLPGDRTIDALLRKRTTMRTDSFYIAGVPAPTFILNQLGLTQGEVSKEENYTFYSANLKGEAMIMRFIKRGELELASVYFNSSIPTSVGEPHTTTAAQLSPNPTNNGHSALSFVKTTGLPWSVAVHDMLGREVLRQAVTAPAGSVVVPLQFAPSAQGVYLYSIYDNNGVRTATGTINVQ